MTTDHFTPPEDGAQDPVDDYDGLASWTDERLVETYRRLSRDIRQRGFDERTVDRMGRIETELRTRGLDPDEVAREVDEEYG